MKKHRIIHHIHRHIISHWHHILFSLLLGFLGVIFLFYLGNFYFEKYNPPIGINFGLTYSYLYAQELGLDPKQTYLDILDNLKVKRLRLNTPWDKIEPYPGKFDFTMTDYLVNLAQTHHTQVILVVGRKQPRWPECRTPDWLNQLPLPQRQQATLDFIQTTIAHYKNNPAITAWEVENEPLFEFGLNCDKPDRTFLIEEVSLVRKLDNRPVILTDSGELRPWRTPMILSDIFGTTLYRAVYDKMIGQLFWPIPPAFYHFKADVIKALFAPKNKKTIIVELQTEPWSNKPIPQTPLGEQTSIMSFETFKNNIEYSKRTGFDEIYLWGVEWWYFMRARGHPEYLEYAKKLF